MHIFGPVASRRLGRSLGINITDKIKTCNLNCIYCELGKTRNLINKRKIFVKTESIIDELKNFLKKNIKIDFITITGNGEPILALNISEIIKEIKKITNIKIAVLTNGILLYDKKVRNDLKNADVVLPSLDAGCENTFLKINRPFKGIDFNKFINGLIKFSKEYKGKIWLEVMVTKNINDSKEEIKKIKKITDKMPSLDKIQINTVVRAAADKTIKPLNYKELLKIKKILGKKAEIIADFKGSKIKIDRGLEKNILNIIKLRPVTLNELLKLIDTDKKNLILILKKFIKEKKAKKIVFNKKYFYKGL